MEKKPKLFFISHSPHLYGAERVLLNIIQYFVQREFPMEVLLPEKGLFSEKLIEMGEVKKHICFFPTLTKKPLGFLRFLLTFPVSLIRIMFLIWKSRPDLVYLNTKFSLIPAFAAYLCRKKVILHAHETNYPGLLGRFIAKCFQFFSDKIIFVSRYSQQAYLEANPALAFKSTVIYNGIRLNPQNLSVEVPQDIQKIKKQFPASRIVGTIGRLEPIKGTADFIKAAKSVLEIDKNVIFFILGDGPLYEELNSMARVLQIEKNIFFLGFRGDIYPIIKAIDILVFPYEMDSFPLSVLEALAIRKPVIVSDRGGLIEIVNSREIGRVVPFSDTEHLAREIIALLENSELREQLGRKGFERYKEHFTIEKQMSSIETLVNSLV